MRKITLKALILATLGLTQSLLASSEVLQTPSPVETAFSKYQTGEMLFDDMLLSARESLTARSSWERFFTLLVEQKHTMDPEDFLILKNRFTLPFVNFLGDLPGFKDVFPKGLEVDSNMSLLERQSHLFTELKTAWGNESAFQEVTPENRLLVDQIFSEFTSPVPQDSFARVSTTEPSSLKDISLLSLMNSPEAFSQLLRVVNVWTTNETTPLSLLQEIKRQIVFTKRLLSNIEIDLYAEVFAPLGAKLAVHPETSLSEKKEIADCMEEDLFNQQYASSKKDVLMSIINDPTTSLSDMYLHTQKLSLLSGFKQEKIRSWLRLLTQPYISIKQIKEAANVLESLHPSLAINTWYRISEDSRATVDDIIEAAHRMTILKQAKDEWIISAWTRVIKDPRTTMSQIKKAANGLKSLNSYLSAKAWYRISEASHATLDEIIEAAQELIISDKAKPKWIISAWTKVGNHPKATENQLKIAMVKLYITEGYFSPAYNSISSRLLSRQDVFTTDYVAQLLKSFSINSLITFNRNLFIKPLNTNLYISLFYPLSDQPTTYLSTRFMELLKK